MLLAQHSDHSDLEQIRLRWLVFPFTALFVFGSTIMSLAALG